LEFAQDDTNYYIVTEFCEGGDVLKKILSLKRFSEKIAAKIMRQLLSAVAYCHSKKIVHRYLYYRAFQYRDLKPENLVLESNDIESNIKVIDFGTSKMFQPKEAMKEILGTVTNKQ